MTIEQLRLVHQAKPFQPFTIHLTDERTYHVPHRDYLSMSPGGRTILVFVTGDAATILDLSTMKALTMDTPYQPTLPRCPVTLDELRVVREANPFRAFTIHLADGRTYRINHRDYLSTSPVGRTVIVYGEDGSFDILDMLLVTVLAVEKPAEPVVSDNAN